MAPKCGRSGFINADVRVRKHNFMAGCKIKTIIFTTCFFVASVNVFVVQPEFEILNIKPKIPAFKSERCRRLISGEENVNNTFLSSNDSYVLDTYKPTEDCRHVLRTRFTHPPVSKQERELPIAFGITVYKGARLLARLLQAIYMPNNVYCIHIDGKSSDVFRKAVVAIIRCLPNVFIAQKSSDVVWGHFSLVEAQLHCMKELLESRKPWKYYISLVGQDFPLYDNKQIVRALQRLNNLNCIEGLPLPKYHEKRIKFVYKLRNNHIHNTGIAKSPPPHNISIYKGSTFIIAIREFVEFVLKSRIGRDFIEFLRDTLIPDETLFASLQQHPLAPGGIHGNRRYRISRAMHWFPKECHGVWKRKVCWISIEDLRWVFGRQMKEKLFVHKIPFDFNDDLLECILAERQGRKYPISM
ncbi:hypothetical protein ACROYT_G000258 [Oculina patagonica]